MYVRAEVKGDGGVVIFSRRDLRGAELGGCDFPTESQRRRGDGGHFLLLFGVGQKYLRKDALNELLCRFARCMVRW